MRDQYIHRDGDTLVTCYLVPGPSLPGADPERDKIISEIQTSQSGRHKGHASRVMQAVCRDADREQVKLYLVVCPDGSPNSLPYEELYQWYERLGFVFIYEDENAMVRHPVVTQLHIIADGDSISFRDMERCQHVISACEGCLSNWQKSYQVTIPQEVKEYIRDRSPGGRGRQGEGVQGRVRRKT